MRSHQWSASELRMRRRASIDASIFQVVSQWFLSWVIQVACKGYDNTLRLGLLKLRGCTAGTSGQIKALLGRQIFRPTLIDGGFLATPTSKQCEEHLVVPRSVPHSIVLLTVARHRRQRAPKRRWITASSSLRFHLLDNNYYITLHIEASTVINFETVLLSPARRNIIFSRRSRSCNFNDHVHDGIYADKFIRADSQMIDSP